MTKKKKYLWPTHTHVIEVYPYFPSLSQFAAKEGKVACAGINYFERWHHTEAGVYDRTRGTMEGQRRCL